MKSLHLILCSTVLISKSLLLGMPCSAAAAADGVEKDLDLSQVQRISSSKINLSMYQWVVQQEQVLSHAH